MYDRIQATVQANYNFTHALYHVCKPHVFQRGEKTIITHVHLNSHGLAKPCVIATQADFMHVPHILSLIGM